MSRRQRILDLRNRAPAILPSMLLCDYGNLASEVSRLEDADAAGLHLDVMDGHFVPNLSYGLPLVEAFRNLTDLPLDVHLMIHHPEDWVERYFEAGADAITIHAETVEDSAPVLKRISELDAAAGLAINPDTPVSAVGSSLEFCDLVLVMSVHAGFGGQKFIPAALEKMREVRAVCGDDVLLEVDGGINRDTIHACAEAGAELFVAGSAVFASEDYGESVAALAAEASLPV
ncbi:MAG: ribulose-phosphate 3-epimerase [Pirellulales bacterium]|nr:ribulose-phosphate 3-epimerase [Pirellulales bacterium]